MKILFVAVFDAGGVSSNTSQAVGLEKLGHTVIRYNYRIRASRIGVQNRDLELVDMCRHDNADLVIFAKCNTISLDVFRECKKTAQVCYWFPDPLKTFQTQEFIDMTSISHFVCCDKNNVMHFAKSYNKNTFQVPDGFDSNLEYPKDLEKNIDISFIGSLHSDRAERLSRVSRDVSVFSDAFGEVHSEIVSRSKINLNFCTTSGASDRIYKILGAGGFLLSDDWEGREEMFDDGKHLVIYKDIDDLNSKIDFYLSNPKLCSEIANAGFCEVQKYSRDNWAKQIVHIAGILSLA